MAYKDSHMNEMPYLSEQGLRMEQELKALSDQYHYRKLPKEVSEAQRMHYMEELDPFWRDGLYRGKEISLTAHDGTVLATGVTDRGFVCGDYGVFLEIDPEQMRMEHVRVAPGQEYRIRDPKYAGNVKYQWYTDTVGDGMKLYFQQKPVTYADYLPGKWYVSPYEVTVEVVREKEKDSYVKAMKDLREAVNHNTEADWQNNNIMEAVRRFEQKVREDERTKLSYPDAENRLQELITRAVSLERSRILDALKRGAINMSEAGNPFGKYCRAVSMNRAEETLAAPIMADILIEEMLRGDCLQAELELE